MFHVAIGHNQKVGYHLSCLKIGLKKLIETGAQKRKIALIIDNCPAHPDVAALDWVELIFLPPNTTSITQPMDKEVIRSFKAKYRFFAVKKQIDALEKRNQLPKFSILTAMFMLMKAWNSIPDGTFTNCFKKSGIPEK